MNPRRDVFTQECYLKRLGPRQPPSMRPSIGGGVGRQRGIAAVELALMMPILVLMLVMPLYLGRVFWHYTVIEHAAQDAARYLSKIPVAELSNPARAPTVVAAANAIVAEELAELSPGGYGYGLLISCDGSVCLGFSKPATVRVNISLLIQDIFFPGLNSLSIPLYADVSYPYLGR